MCRGQGERGDDARGEPEVVGELRAPGPFSGGFRGVFSLLVPSEPEEMGPGWRRVAVRSHGGMWWLRLGGKGVAGVHVVWRDYSSGMSRQLPPT